MHTRAHTHTQIQALFKEEKGERRHLDPGLTIHLFFAPSEGSSQLWLIMLSVWSLGQAGTDAYTTLPQIVPSQLKAVHWWS